MGGRGLGGALSCCGCVRARGSVRWACGAREGQGEAGTCGGMRWPAEALASEGEMVRGLARARCGTGLLGLDEARANEGKMDVRERGLGRAMGRLEVRARARLCVGTVEASRWEHGDSEGEIGV